MNASQAAMNRFLASVEKRAFAMTRIAGSNTEDALDIVQNSMLQLVEKYAHKPEEEWAPLFYRILKNRTTDFYRRSARQNRLFTFMLSARNQDNEVVDASEMHAGRASDEPENRSSLDAASQALNASLAQLPPRQCQAFLLRTWEGLSVDDTAKAMNCSAGSVKTHYFRAVHALRKRLGAHWS